MRKKTLRKDTRDADKIIAAQRRRIRELEQQLDYFHKRFVAAKQAAQWLESKLRLRFGDSFGT